jgi:hypothetical protein
MARRQTKNVARSVHADEKIHDRRATDLPIGANVALAEVEDPLERGATLLVVRSIRDDQLAALRARGQIAAHQYAAGRAWQRLYEQAEIGGARSLDPRKLHVDGGSPSGVIAVRRQRAIKHLVHIGRSLGQHGAALLYDVLVSGLTLRKVALARGLDARAGSHDLVYLGRRLRECLDTVAHELHLA